MATAIEIASLFATLELRDTMTGALQGAGRQLNTFEQRLGSWGRGLQRAGAGLTALSAPLLGFGAAGIQAASNFEGVMTQLKMFGGLGPAQLQMVSDAALQMGADTMFSAQDAAEAMLEFAKSGLEVEAAMGGARQALDLAAVGSLSVADAAGIMTSALSIFNLDPIDEANQVVDALAQAASASRADVSDLADALVTGGPVAAQYGLSIQDAAAALAVMADNGIMGADAGTQLRSMLLNMNRTTNDVRGAWNRLGTSFYNTDGTVRDFNVVMMELDEALDQLPVEEQNELMQTLAGSYGITGFAALRAAGGIGNMQEAMEATPAASDLASSAMDTFAGRMDSLKGSVEALMITALTPFMENVLTPLADKAIVVVNAITDWVDKNPELASTLVPVIAGALVLGPALLAVGTYMTLAAPAVGALAGAFALLTSPVMLVAAGIAGIVALGLSAAGTLDALEKGVGDVLQGIGLMATGSKIAGKWAIQVGLEEIRDALLQTPVNLLRELVLAFERLTGLDLSAVVIDFNALKDRITVGIQTAFNNVAVDFNALGNDIQAGIQGQFGSLQIATFDLSGVQAALETHMGEILNIGAMVIGVVFGGPVNWGIAIVRLVSDAIANDFLGLGTFLQESGIADSVTSALTDLQATIDSIIQGVFAQPKGGKGAKGGEEAGLELFGRFFSFTTILERAQGILGGMVDDLVPGLKDLGAGLVGFFNNLAGADTSGLVSISAVILGFGVGALSTLTSIAGGVLSGLGTALPEIGSAISSFLNAISAVTRGDWSGALTSLGEGVTNLDNAFAGFVEGVADGVIDALEDLTGAELPSVEEGLEAWRGVVDDIGIIFDTLKSDVETKLNDLWITIQPTVQPIFDFFNVTLPGAIATFVASVEGIWASVSQWFNELKTGIEGALGPVKELIDGIVLGLQTIASGLGGYSDVGTNAAAIAASGASPGDIITATFNAIGAEIAGSRQAGGSIPRTGLYQLHQGEDVLNRQEARMFRRGGMGGAAYVYAYGENPYALIDKIDRARRNRGR